MFKEILLRLNIDADSQIQADDFENDESYPIESIASLIKTQREKGSEPVLAIPTEINPKSGLVKTVLIVFAPR